MTTICACNAPNGCRHADAVEGITAKASSLGALSAKHQHERDIARREESRLRIENRRLRDALLGVLKHYHAPCDGCWEALGQAHAALGDPDTPVIGQAVVVQGSASQEASDE